MPRRIFIERTYIPFDSDDTEAQHPPHGTTHDSRRQRCVSFTISTYRVYAHWAQQTNQPRGSRHIPSRQPLTTEKGPSMSALIDGPFASCVSSSRGAMRRAHRCPQRGPQPHQPRPTQRNCQWRRGYQYEPARETDPQPRRGSPRQECQHPEPGWKAAGPKESQPGPREPEHPEPGWKAAGPKESQPGQKAAGSAGRSTGSERSAGQQAWQDHSHAHWSCRRSAHCGTARR